MMKEWFLALIAAFGLGGCAGLTQFPAVANDYDAALRGVGEKRGLDTEYATTLDRIYGKDPVNQTGGEQRRRRERRHRLSSRLAPRNRNESEMR